jgi:hypothetical protein
MAARICEGPFRRAFGWDMIDCDTVSTHLVGCWMKLIPTKANREIISWLGGDAVVVVGATWTLFTYFHGDQKPSGPAATVVNSSQSVVAPGGTFNGPVNLFDAQKNDEQLNAATNRILEAIAREKGVPFEALKATLVKMGDENVRDEDIAADLDKKADELITLRKTIAKLKSRSPELASTVQEIQNSIDDGNFSGGLRLVLDMMKMQNEDFRKAMAIAESMQSDNQKQQVERWKILQDTQEQIFSIQKDVTLNKAQTNDPAYKKWDEYIRP